MFLVKTFHPHKHLCPRRVIRNIQQDSTHQHIIQLMPVLSFIQRDFSIYSQLQFLKLFCHRWSRNNNISIKFFLEMEIGLRSICFELYAYTMNWFIDSILAKMKPKISKQKKFQSFFVSKYNTPPLINNPPVFNTPYLFYSSIIIIK